MQYIYHYNQLYGSTVHQNNLDLYEVRDFACSNPDTVPVLPIFKNLTKFKINYH